LLPLRNTYEPPGRVLDVRRPDHRNPKTGDLEEGASHPRSGDRSPIDVGSLDEEIRHIKIRAKARHLEPEPPITNRPVEVCDGLPLDPYAACDHVVAQEKRRFPDLDPKRTEHLRDARRPFPVVNEYRQRSGCHADSVPRKMHRERDRTVPDSHRSQRHFSCQRKVPSAR